MRRLGGAPEPRPAAPAFEVLDLFEGFASLERRSPTLDGSVPVRVAQACLPLLEGNAYGFQVRLRHGLRVARRLGALHVQDVDGALTRLHAAALPRLVAHGLVAAGSPWHRALSRGAAVVDRLPRRRPRLRLFTGLLVRPAPGTWLRVTNAANRRNTLLEVAESVIPDDGAFVPLVVTLTLPAGGLDRVRLEGEIACLAPVEPDVRIAVRPLAAAAAVGRAHAAFYDQAYFDEKRAGGVTVKYRRLVAHGASPGSERGGAECEVVLAGPAPHEIVGIEAFTTAQRPDAVERPHEKRRLQSVIFRNPIGFEALYDGHTVALDYDRDRLAAAAREVRRTWAGAYGQAFLEEHRGAMLYLTKYFTPHPPGEPHFFVKPWALTRTPPGWSSLLDGIHGEGYDVLRGVVATDLFHATPAVFLVRREAAIIRVAERAPLLRVLPVPRRLLDAGFSVARLTDSL